MNAIELNIDRVLADLKHIVHVCEELVHATKDIVGDKAMEVRERLAKALDSAKHTCQRLEKETLAGAKAADRIVREHPYPSMGAAFGAGLLLGVLVTRR